jgi:GNAT superfamily N-acetyltransferase
MSNPQFQVRFDTSLSDEDRHILLGWSEDPFGINHLHLKGRRKDFHFLGYEKGQLVSHVGLVKDEVQVAGNPMPVAGIGGVVTIPSARGKGYAHILLQHAAGYVCAEMNVEYGMLFCLPALIPFYQSAGWVEVNSPVFVAQPLGRIVSPVNTMVLPCDRERIWPEGTIEAGTFW